MVKIIFCAVFIFAMMIGISTTSAAEYMYTPTISVSGEGVVEAPPDVATISVGVVSRDRDAAKVQNENSRAANNVINAIASLGIDRKNIRTGNYNFREIFHSDTNHKQIFDGYEVTNTVTITVTDAALSNGANAVNSLHFGIRDREKFQSEALRLAVRDARKKAEIAAAELGKVIVSVKNVSINSASVTMPRMEKMAMMSANDATFETPIESGTLSCSASVHVEFEISR